MARAPCQVLVMPFRRTPSGGYEFAALRRSDDGSWQGVAGGAHDGERPDEAAARETREELGIDPTDRLFRLSTLSSIPAFHFSARLHWPSGTYVVPEHAFAVDCSGLHVTLSAEHTALAWLTPEEAASRLRWDSNRTAMWELIERLRGADLHGPSDADRV